MPVPSASNPRFRKLWIYTIANGLPPIRPPPVGYRTGSNGRLIHKADGFEPSWLHNITSPPPSTQQLPIDEIEGLYLISCPELEKQYSDGGFALVFTVDTTTFENPVVRGAYNFGNYVGLLQLSPKPTIISPFGLSFMWRGKDSQGEIHSFDESEDCEIKFLGRGVIQGSIGLDDKILFEGIRKVDQPSHLQLAESMAVEWRVYEKEHFQRDGESDEDDSDDADDLDENMA